MILLPVFREMERFKETVAIVLNDVWHSGVIGFGCITSRILCTKFRFSRFKVCVGMEYDPNEGKGVLE